MLSNHAQTAPFLHFMLYIDCHKMWTADIDMTFEKLKITKRKHTKQRSADPKLYQSRARPRVKTGSREVQMADTQMYTNFLQLVDAGGIKK